MTLAVAQKRQAISTEQWNRSVAGARRSLAEREAKERSASLGSRDGTEAKLLEQIAGLMRQFVELASKGKPGVPAPISNPQPTKMTR
jgi:hypothetical protein